jgi:hypothetical protein
VKKLIPFTHSPELVGIVCGLMIFSAWPCLELILLKAGWALVGIAVIAGVAGFIVAARAGQFSPGMERRVRRGAWAGFFAVMVAAACLVFMTRLKFGGHASLRAILVAVASVMPAIIVGTFAAGGGAYLLQSREVPIPEPVPGANDLPRAARLTIRAGIFGALLVALVSPLIPESPKVTQVTMPPATKEEEPVRPLPPPREPFKYTMPEALKTASPVSWSVRGQREVGPLRSDRGLALSRTGSFLAGLESDGRIVVYDLDSDIVRRMSPLPSAVLQLAISPDSKRLFVVLEGDPRKVGVMDMETESFIALPQPKKHAVPDSQVSWWKDQGVVFLTDPKNPLMLDLEWLEFNPANLTSGEIEQMNQEVALELPKNDRWSFAVGSRVISAELPEVEGTRDWQWRAEDQLIMTDRIHASRRTFGELGIRSNDRLFGTMDGARILQIRDGRLTAFYFQTGPVPPLRWKITLPHSPDKMREKDSAMRALAQGELSLLMYAPLINPLNDRTIGPDRERPKAVLRFLRWEGLEAEVWIEAGTTSYSPGDVLADVHVPGTPPQLQMFDQPHRWWMLAPDPVPAADDPAKLPLRSELEKLLNVSKENVPAAPPIVSLPEAVPDQLKAFSKSDIEESLRSFILRFHQLSTEGNLTEMVKCYADVLDFNHRSYPREEWLGGLRAVRESKKYFHEKVDGRIVIRDLGGTKFEARYTMKTEYERKDENKIRKGIAAKTLTIEGEPGAWRITRQLMEKSR